MQEQNLGVALVRDTSAEVGEGECVLAHNFQVSARVLGPAHPTTVSSMAERGWALVALKRNDEALALFQECVPLAERTVGPDHHVTAYAMQGLETALRHAGRSEEANALVPRYMAAWLRIYGPGNAFTRGITVKRLHRLAVAYGRPDEAARFAEEQLAEFRGRRQLAPDSPIVGALLLVLADARLEQDRVAEARESLRQATAILEKEEPTMPPLWMVHCRLGEYFRKQGDLAAAEAELRVAYEGICDRKTWDASAGNVLRWNLQLLVWLYTAWEQPAKAVEWQQKLEAFDQVQIALPP